MRGCFLIGGPSRASGAQTKWGWISPALVALLCAASGPARAQSIINTVAGTEWTFPGPSMPALSAPLGGVSGGAFDSRGNFYFADTTSHLVFRLSPGGIVTVVAGNGRPGLSGDGGPATQASLNEPAGVALDAAGNLYIADARNGRIRQVLPDGAIRTFAGGGANFTIGLRDGIPADQAWLQNPRGVAVDSRRNVYIADTFNDRVVKVTAAGLVSNVPLPLKPGNIYAVAVDRDDTLFVALQFAICKLPFAGAASVVSQQGFSWINGISVDSAGMIYITEYNTSLIKRVDSLGRQQVIGGDGVSRFAGDGRPATQASFRKPTGVIPSPDGSLYIPDRDNYRIRVIDRSGVVNTLAGNGRFRLSADGIPAISATLSNPLGAAVAPDGTLYIADCDTNRVRKVDRGGRISTVAGTGEHGFSGDGGPAVSAALRCPMGLALDRAGNLFIADTGNDRIRRVRPSGIIESLLSVPSGQWSTPRFYLPEDLAADPSGNVYYAESGKIKRLSPSGQAAVVGDLAAGSCPDCVNGLDVGPDGVIYYTNWAQNQVYRMSPAGVSAPIPAGSLQLPTSVKLLPGGDLIVVDGRNHRIQRVTPSGVVTTISGFGLSSSSFFFGDGGLATNASLYYPTTAAVGPNGEIYIVDTGNHRIRALLNVAPALAVDASSLSATVEQGTSGSIRRAIRVSSPVAGLEFSVTTSAPWLSVSPASGAAPAILDLAVDSRSLSPGSYDAVITVANPLASPPSLRVAVAVTVVASAPPKLALGEPSLAISTVQGAAPSTLQTAILNRGGGELTYQASVTAGQNWLTANPASGIATAAQSGSLTLTANPAGLAPGTYRGTVSILAGNGESLAMAVVLSVGARQQKILLSQAGLAFTAVSGGGAPAPQSFGILNEGRGALTWSARASTLAGGDWLRLAAASGRVERPLLDVSLVDATVDAARLAAGEYYGRIEITADADNSPQIVTVLLKVLPPGSNPGPEVRPAGLIFTGLQAATPGSQDVRIHNLTDRTLTLVSSLTNARWLKPLENLNITPGLASRVVVQPDYSGLPVGVHRGLITFFDPADGTSRSANVLAVVAPADSKSAPYRGAANCPSNDLNIEFTSLRSDFVAVIGQPTTIEVRIVDSCGNPLTNSGGHAAVVHFERDPQLRLSHLGDGVWQGSWTPANLINGPTFVRVVAAYASGTKVQVGVRSLTGTVRTTGAVPRVFPGGVTNAATGVAATASPGGYVSIYGIDLAARNIDRPVNPLPVDIEGVRVYIGGQQVPIRYVGENQINALVPFTIPVNTTHQVLVRRDDRESVGETITLAPAHPGIYGSGGRAIVQNASRGSQLVSDQAPAAAGDTIVIYCNGLGPVEGNPSAGTAVSAAARTVNAVTLTIGGRDAQVLYAGLTPGIPGLYQINAVVPSGVSGSAVPLVIRVAGQESPPAPTVIR